MPRESLTARRERTTRINRVLKRLYPAKTALTHSNPFELLIATILSAQCTDVRVNQVVPDLFSRYPTIEDFAGADREELEELIRSTGFFRSKATSILTVSEQILTEHDGRVPQSMEQLLTLRGVGRKTANVVLGSAFGQSSGVVVDTHVGRLSRRMSLTRHDDPVKVEQDLMKLLPQKEWIGFSHRMIWHGRDVCRARRPKCGECPVATDCPSVGVLLPPKPPGSRKS